MPLTKKKVSKYEDDKGEAVGLLFCKDENKHTGNVWFYIIFPHKDKWFDFCSLRHWKQSMLFFHLTKSFCFSKWLRNLKLNRWRLGFEAVLFYEMKSSNSH